MNYPPHGPPQAPPPGPNGWLDITVEHGATQFILMAVQPTIEIDGYPQKRPWGRHVIEMYPGQHMLRVWFDYMGQSGMSQLMVPIWSAQSTVVTYKTPFFVTSSGTLQMVGTRPAGAW
jgi:hypothetical protein